MKLGRNGIIGAVGLVVAAALVVFVLGRPGSAPGPSPGPTSGPSGSAGHTIVPVGTTPGETSSPIATATGVPTLAPTLPGGSPPPATATPAPGADVTGTWSGTWKSSTMAGEGNIEIQWTQDGAALSGSIQMDGTSCLSGGVVTGAVSGLHIDFSVSQREVTIDYSGTISGGTMAGTFSTGCDIGQGSWTMAKAP